MKIFIQFYHFKPIGIVIIFSLFQTLSSISAEKNSTIIFPLPLDLIKNQIMKCS